MENEITQLISPEIIAVVVGGVLVAAAAVAKLTKTKKDDEAIEAVRKKIPIISSVLAKIAGALLMFRKKK